MSFPDQLKELMTKKNMKAVDLARATGLSEAAISDYLKGKKEPRGRQSIAIAKALDVSLDTLWETGFQEKSFPARLKAARIAMGYTQQQVADLLGITNSTYCGYETGKRQPDVEKIKQLASALNISGDGLLEAGLSNTDEADSPKSAKLNKALEIFKTLNPDFQDYALEQIKKLAELQEKK